MTRVEVITGLERRRRWSEEQKRAIVAETLEPGAVVAEVARRADIRTDQIYRWRKKMRTHGDPGEGFARVLVAPPEEIDAPFEERAGCCAAPAIEIEFAGRTGLRIPGSIPGALAAAVVKALARP
jgi:transposase